MTSWMAASTSGARKGFRRQTEPLSSSSYWLANPDMKITGIDG